MAGRLAELVRVPDKGSQNWTLDFRSLATLLEEHFRREEDELLPAAREILSDDIGPAVLMVVLSVAVTFGVDQLADWLSRLGA